MLELEMFRLEMLRLGTRSWEMLRLAEWNGPPQPQEVRDAVMDICKCNQVQLVETPHTG